MCACVLYKLFAHTHSYYSDFFTFLFYFYFIYFFFTSFLFWKTFVRGVCGALFLCVYVNVVTTHTILFFIFFFHQFKTKTGTQRMPHPLCSFLLFSLTLQTIQGVFGVFCVCVAIHQNTPFFLKFYFFFLFILISINLSFF